jgi:phosphonate transport system substrate-binding protein
MKWFRALAILVFWPGFGGQAAPQAVRPPASPGLKAARLYFVASQSLIGNFKKEDATATMPIWIKQLCEVQGLRCDVRVDIVYSIAEIRRRIHESSVDLLLLDTPEYLLLAHEGLVAAVAAGSTSRGQLAAYPYLLLLKDETGPAQIATLRGKAVRVASRTGSNLGLIWLEDLLAENKLERASSFFGSVSIDNRASSCVLAVFFGKLDACVVDSGNWEMITELNPQITRLRIAARSEALLEGLFAMPIEPRHAYKQEIVKAILNLHRSALGDQLSIIFKAGPQVAVNLKDFEAEANLLNRYRGLLKFYVDPLTPIIGRLNDVREIR